MTRELIALHFSAIEEYLGDTENWELADGSTPDASEAYKALSALRAIVAPDIASSTARPSQ